MNKEMPKNHESAEPNVTEKAWPHAEKSLSELIELFIEVSMCARTARATTNESVFFRYNFLKREIDRRERLYLTKCPGQSKSGLTENYLKDAERVAIKTVAMERASTITAPSN